MNARGVDRYARKLGALGGAALINLFRPLPGIAWVGIGKFDIVAGFVVLGTLPSLDGQPVVSGLADNGLVLGGWLIVERA